MTKEVVAQIIGIVGVVSNMWSFQQKNKYRVVFFQLLGSSLFILNYALLGAMTGALINILQVATAIIFLFKDKTHAHHFAWIFILAAFYGLSYASVFLFFGKEPNAKNLIIEFLPVIGGMLGGILSYRTKNAGVIRIFGIIKTPVWLTYNIVAFSIGAILSDLGCLVSMFVGILRLDVKKKNVMSDENGEGDL